MHSMAFTGTERTSSLYNCSPHTLRSKLSKLNKSGKWRLKWLYLCAVRNNLLNKLVNLIEFYRVSAAREVE